MRQGSQNALRLTSRKVILEDALNQFRLGLSSLVVFVFDLALAWLWSVLIADYAVRAALKSWRFHGQAWRSIEV